MVWYKEALSVPIPSASASFIFLVLGNLFLSPVKEDEEDIVEDDEEDGKEEEDEEDEEEEEVEDVVVDVSIPSFRFGRLLLTGTKLIVALSCCPIFDTEYLRRSLSSLLPGNCWLNEYSASLTKVKVAIVGRWDRCG